jgi:hypothetical protein
MRARAELTSSGKLRVRFDYGDLVSFMEIDLPEGTDEFEVARELQASLEDMGFVAASAPKLVENHLPRELRRTVEQHGRGFLDGRAARRVTSRVFTLAASRSVCARRTRTRARESRPRSVRRRGSVRARAPGHLPAGEDPPPQPDPVAPPIAGAQ